MVRRMSSVEVGYQIKLQDRLLDSSSTSDPVVNAGFTHSVPRCTSSKTGHFDPKDGIHSNNALKRQANLGSAPFEINMRFIA